MNTLACITLTNNVDVRLRTGPKNKQTKRKIKHKKHKKDKLALYLTTH